MATKSPAVAASLLMDSVPQLVLALIPGLHRPRMAQMSFANEKKACNDDELHEGKNIIF
jgi:hypothetical protein